MWQNETYKKLGIRIAYIRKLRGWDQDKLAREVGLTSSYISKIETGNRSGVSMDTYASIADALGIPLWKLVKIDEE